MVAGIGTEICVAQAALDATQAGYRVHVVLDASGHFDPRATVDAVFRMRAGGVVVTSVAAMLIELAGTSPESEASDLLAIGLRHTLSRSPALGRIHSSLIPEAILADGSTECSSFHRMVIRQRPSRPFISISSSSSDLRA